MTRRSSRLRRLLADLRRPDTRNDAVVRIRRRAASTLRLRGGARPSGQRGAGTGRPGSAAHAKPDSWFVGEWSRLGRALLDVGADGERSPLDPARAGELVTLAHRHRAQAVLAESLARGDDLERAVCRAVAALTDATEWNPAWAMAEGVGRAPGGARARTLGHGLLLHRRRQLARAWTLLAELDDASLATYLPVEAVDAALAAGTDEARRRALAIAAPTPGLEPATLVDLAGRFLAMGDSAHAAILVAELRRRPSVELDARRRQAWALIEGWLSRPAPTVPEGAVPVAILGYRSPDPVLTSGNVGDYIQTLALLGNLARLRDVTFTGEDGLGELATELRGRVRPDLSIPDARGALHLLAVDRDFSSVAAVPDGTWAIAFGWHMHALFDLRYDFPYHPGIRPLFLSFHVNRLEMLTEEGLEYLRRYGPIGCRDWNTVYLLLSAGVDAFFTGCLTTTVDALFPERSQVYAGNGAVGVIDMSRKAAGAGEGEVRAYTHQSDEYRAVPVVDGVRAASDVLAEYQRDLDRAVTGRLHAYLPLTSLGVPVEFRPGRRGDVRFAGLTGLVPGDPRLAEIRDGIRDLFARVFSRVAAGAGEDEVYATWRELTSERVAAARARFDAPLAEPPTTIDVPAAVAASMAGSRRFGPHATIVEQDVTDVVIAYDQNLTYPAAVMIESMVANASGPLRLWILGRGLPDTYQAWLGGAFPDLPITFIPCDQIAYGPAGRPRRLTSRITISSMDRLLLPVMLEHVDRVVYVDVDTLVLGDVCALGATDLRGTPVAARDSNVSEASEWRRSVGLLDEPTATEVRRGLGHEHGYGSAALNAGVLVMDLDRMRRDDFTRRYLGWVEAYGLHDQDTMLAYAGPRRARLDPRWNTLPVMEDVPEPHLIHWASLGKPWEPHLTFAQDRWLAYAARLRARAGVPPAAGPGVVAPKGSLANPVEIGATTTPLTPGVESVIAAVRAEHLSYLDATSLRTLAATVEEIEAAGLDGLIVEAGTARGGSAIVMAVAKSAGRRMRVYDVFGMIPPPGEMDGDDVHRRYATIVAGQSKGIGGETYYGYREDLLAEVTASFARHGVPLPDTGVDLVPGLFEDTLRLDQPVALAHLDGDWYASTMTCLTRIAPLLVPGGRIVVDDYDTWSGCRVAVNEYFAGRPGFRFERRGRLHIVRD